MTSIENQSQQNRRLRRTWPFRRHRAIVNEDTNCKNDFDAEVDLTHHDSLKTIFMTDSSKIIQISERNISQNSTPKMTSMNAG